MSGMSEPVFHDYAENPTAPHDLRPNADLIARLKRPSVGASDAEAQAMADQLDPDVIRAESDELLAARVVEFRENGEVFDPASSSVAEVEAHVGDDVNKAREALAAEQGRDKPRKTLLTKLDAIIDAQQVNTPPVVVVGDHPAAVDGPSQNSTDDGTPTSPAVDSDGA